MISPWTVLPLWNPLRRCRFDEIGLTREGLRFAKGAAAQGHGGMDGVVNDVVQSLKTLRQRSRAALVATHPAMTVGLTDRIWNIGDILRAVPMPPEQHSKGRLSNRKVKKHRMIGIDWLTAFADLSDRTFDQRAVEGFEQIVSR